MYLRYPNFLSYVLTLGLHTHEFSYCQLLRISSLVFAETISCGAITFRLELFPDNILFFSGDKSVFLTCYDNETGSLDCE
jgi:hypothetical protein